MLILLTRHNRFLKSNCSKVHGDRVTNKTRCVAVPSLMSARWVSQNSGPIFRHLWTKVHRTRCGAEHSVRAALRVLPPGECYWLVNASRLNYGPVGGSKLRSYFSPFVDQSSPDYVSRRGRDHRLQRRLSISYSVPEIFAIEMWSRPKSPRKKASFSASIFWGEDPQILDLVFKIAPISDHVAKFRSDQLRDRADRALNKKKKETAAKHKGRVCVITQRTALIKFACAVVSVVCNAIFRLMMSCCVLEIFAIKSQSCAKLRQNVDVFGPPNFGEGKGPPKFLNTWVTIERVAKFGDDRPNDLWD